MPLRLIVSLLVLAFCAQASAINLDALIEDTQQTKSDANELKLVWWIPIDFWQASLEMDPNLPEEERKEILGLLSQYTAFAVVDAGLGYFGGIKPRTRKEIEKDITYEANGVKVEAIPLEDLNADARNLFAAMKPMMAQMIGQVGQGMEFFIYPNKEGKKAYIDATKPGTFTLTLDGTPFTWNLPLASLLPPVKDPDTGEQFPGNYKFNPYTGTKLVPVK